MLFTRHYNAHTHSIAIGVARTAFSCVLSTETLTLNLAIHSSLVLDLTVSVILSHLPDTSRVAPQSLLQQLKNEERRLIDPLMNIHTHTPFVPQLTMVMAHLEQKGHHCQ